MNRTVRRIALMLGVAFAALIVQLTYVQVVEAERFAEHPSNRRLLVKEYSIERGSIVAGETILARSKLTNDNLKYLREYPGKGLWGHITGYYSIVFGGAGLERTYNDFLIGAGPEDRWENIVDDILGRARKGHTLLLTIDPDLQALAAKALKGQRGAVAAINPENGEVLALYANPTFDPNPLSSHDLNGVRSSWDKFNASPAKPLVFRATQERYPPGSTFKVIMTAAALEDGIPKTKTYPNPRVLDLPLTDRTLRNFSGGACAGGGRISMAQALRVSCNTTFAQIGMELGPEKIEEMTRGFGFGASPVGFDLPAASSCLVAEPGGGCAEPTLDDPQTAFSSIGQFSVRVTPLQMALVAAAASNGGMLVRPHVVREIQDFTGKVVHTVSPEPDGPIFSRQTAATLRDLMIDVVDNGTGRPAAIPSLRGEMGGKTGTAQTGVEGENPHVWFIAFGPGIAVAVVVENGGDAGGDATGGRVAGPIAKALIEAVQEGR
ncbi:MAG: penicillin-binding transpeptidase domain-containing protein [Actinomycetota bacterium]